MNSVSPAPIASSRSTTTRPGTLGGCMVHLDGKPLADRLRLGRQHAQAGIDAKVGACRIGSSTTSPRAHRLFADA
jgi:hypothetical protein